MTQTLRRVAAALAVAGASLLAFPTASFANDGETCRVASEKSIAACSRIISSPKSTREQIGIAYINRGQRHYEKDEDDEALADWKRAIALKPKWLQLAYGNAGNVYFKKKEDQTAIDYYDKAISLDSNYTSAYAARGLIYERMGMIEKARADFQAAIKSKSIFDDDKWGHEIAATRLKDLIGK